MNSKRPLVYIGARGDFSMFTTITQLLDIEVLGILDQYYWGNTDSIQGIPIIGNELDLLSDKGKQLKDTCDFIVTSYWNGSQHLNDVGLNNELVRIQRCDLADQAQVNLINLLHPQIFQTPGHDVRLGKGIIMGPLGGFMRNVVVGDHCQLDTIVSFGHDVTLGRNVLIGSHTVLSNTIIDENCKVGVNCSIIGAPGNHGTPIHVGKSSTVWTGVSLFRDVPPDSIVVPAMPKVLAKQRKL